MDLHSLVKSKLTPDDVLSILRDQHRHQCQHDPEAAPDIGLTFDTTVADWRYACDLVGWRQLALALNDYWETKIPLHKWKTALAEIEDSRLDVVAGVPAIEPLVAAEQEALAALVGSTGDTHRFWVACAHHKWRSSFAFAAKSKMLCCWFSTYFASQTAEFGEASI